MTRRSTRLAQREAAPKQAIKTLTPKKACQKNQLQKIQLQKLQEELEKCKAEIAAAKLSNNKLKQTQEIHGILNAGVREESEKKAKEAEEWRVKASEKQAAFFDYVAESEKDYLIAVNTQRIAENTLAKKQEVINHHRQEYLNLAKQQVQKEVEKTKTPWQICEICLIPYSKEMAHTPRILSCGHTLCLDCLKKMAKGTALMCPFDRQTTVYGRPIDEAPINHAILDMC